MRPVLTFACSPNSEIEMHVHRFSEAFVLVHIHLNSNSMRQDSWTIDYDSSDFIKRYPEATSQTFALINRSR